MRSRDFVSFATVWCVGLLLITGITASITEGPSNTVAEIGKQVQLNCTTDQNDMSNINWFLSRDGSSNGQLEIVGEGCQLNSGFEDHYRTENIENTCNLVIFDITMQHAGVYKCREGLDMSASILTIIDIPPNITVNTTTAVVENEDVVIECSLIHKGSLEPASTLRPHFYWTDQNGQNVSSSYDSTTVDTTLSKLTVRAGRQNITSYTCHVYMQLIPSTNPNYANNIPSVNSSASSPIIEVLYRPDVSGITSKSRIITIDGTTCESVTFTCTSDGNPPPNYQWFDFIEGVWLSNNATLDLAEPGRNYICYAYNTIRNETYIDSLTVLRSISVHNCKFPHNESTWINVTFVEGCDDGTCACSDEYDSLTLTCNANTFPNASYKWIGPDNTVFNSQVLTDVTSNGVYHCIAYFDQTMSNYTGDVKFSNGTSDKNVIECNPLKKPENGLLPETMDLLNGT